MVQSCEKKTVDPITRNSSKYGNPSIIAARSGRRINPNDSGRSTIVESYSRTDFRRRFPSSTDMLS